MDTCQLNQIDTNTIFLLLLLHIRQYHRLNEHEFSLIVALVLQMTISVCVSVFVFDWMFAFLCYVNLTPNTIYIWHFFSFSFFKDETNIEIQKINVLVLLFQIVLFAIFICRSVGYWISVFVYLCHSLPLLSLCILYSPLPLSLPLFFSLDFKSPLAA